MHKRKTENKLLVLAKYRAKKRNLDFNLTLEDIKIPEVCPVLGIKLQKNKGGKTASDNSPSIDRIDNNKGYVKGNIQIVSFRANTIKGYASKEELQKVLKYVENNETLFSYTKKICSNLFKKLKKVLKIS